jgi:hypothetical protein
MDEIDRLNPSLIFPHHHIAVDRRARHLTVLVLMRFPASIAQTGPLDEVAKEVFFSMSIDNTTTCELGSLMVDGIDLDAYEIRSYDSATAIQFRGDGRLAKFREVGRKILAPIVEGSLSLFPDGMIEPMIHGSQKNFGDLAYGSIARSPLPGELDCERWRRAISNPVRFRFTRIHLLVSDEALTNPRTEGLDDLVIGV